MASTFRIIALIFVVSPLAAMFSEPFFEAVFDILGWDTESWAAPVAKMVFWVTSFLGNPQLVSATLYLAALGAGVWLHYFASIRDRKRPSKMSDFHEMRYRIANFTRSYSKLRGCWMDNWTQEKDRGRWKAELAAEYIALANDLSKLKIKLPLVETATSDIQWELKSQAISNLLSFLTKFSETGNYIEAVQHSQQMSDSINSKFRNP